MPFEIVRNDITRMRVDAIVNAANQSLMGGGGVDGVIHRAVGPGLLEECRTLGGCPTGQAKRTGGYRLPCKYVIHTVGPIWRGGGHGERALLQSCYANSLQIAFDSGCESVAFPLISAGAYGYPRAEALEAATEAIRAFLDRHELTVYLVIYDSASFAIGRALYDDIRAFIDDSSVPPDFENAQALRMRHTGAIPPLPKARLPKPSPKRAKAAAPTEEALGDLAAPMDAAPGLDDYLKQLDEGFRDMLLRKIDERGMTDAECYKRANVDRKLFNKIKNQPGYRPGKPTALAFAVALRLPLDETRELLDKAGFSLSHSSRFDLIVEYFIRQGRYDIYEINEALFAFDQRLLGSGA